MRRRLKGAPRGTTPARPSSSPSPEVGTMKRKALCGIALAAAALGGAAPAAAATQAAKAAPLYHYWFRGTVAAAPAPGTSTFAMNVTMADKGAQHFLDKNGTSLTFNAVPTTSFIAIEAAPSGRGNVPVATNVSTLAL